MNRRKLTSAIAVAAILASSMLPQLVRAETAVVPEISPPGDIPDNQAFIEYRSPGGFSVKVPEGWARADGTNETVFRDKYNRIALATRSFSQPIDLTYAKMTLVPEIEKSERAVKILRVSQVKLRAGKSIKISFDTNSEPNAVTSKQIRQENERYYYVKGDKLAMLTLTAPKGADNVDQWKMMSSSFRWN